MQPLWQQKLAALGSGKREGLIRCIEHAKSAENKDVIEICQWLKFEYEEIQCLVDHVLGRNNTNNDAQHEKAPHAFIASLPPAYFNAILKERWPITDTAFNIEIRKCFYWSWHELDFGHKNKDYRRFVEEKM